MTELAPVKHYVVQALETFEQARDDERKGRFPQAAQGIAKAHYILDELIPSLPDYSRFCAHTPNPFLDSYKQLRSMVAVSLPPKQKLASESLPAGAPDDLTLRFQKLRGSHSAPKPPSAIPAPAQAKPQQTPPSAPEPAPPAALDVRGTRRVTEMPPSGTQPSPKAVRSVPRSPQQPQPQPHLQPHAPQPPPQPPQAPPPQPPQPSATATGTASVDTVQCWLRNMKHRLLFLDVRDRTAYDAGHIDAPIICCLEPVSLRANMTDSELEDSLVIAPEPEMDAFSTRPFAEKVIIYTQNASAGAELDPPLLYVYSALQRAGIRPVLLAGGYDAWVHAGHATARSATPEPAFEKPTQDVAEEFAQELDRELQGSAELQASERSPFALPAATNGDWIVRNGRLEHAGAAPKQNGLRSQPLSNSLSNFSPHSNLSDLSNQSSPYLNGRTASRPPFSPHSSFGLGLAHSAHSGLSVNGANGANGHSVGVNGHSVGVNGINGHGNGYVPPMYSPPPPPPPHAPVYSRYTPPAVPPPPASVPPPGPAGPGSRFGSATPQPIPRPPVPIVSPVANTLPSHAILDPRDESRGSTVVPTPWPKNQTYLPALSFLTGLRNLGNTCYMNCVIQCLSGTPQLAVPFLDKSYQRFVNPKSRLGYQGRLANEYAALVKAMAKAGNGGYVAAKGMKKLAGRLQDTFDGTDQQDCQEFLVFLLDGLHEDLNENGHRARVPELDEREERVREQFHVRLASTIEWERYLKSDTSLIVDIFQGQYLSRLQCTVCGTTSTTYTAFSTLSLPLVSGHRIDLLDCFNQFVAPEILDGDDAWHCPSCKRRQRTIKTMSISRLPPVLIIHLKRFRRTMYSVDKLETAITYPLHHLDLTRYWPNPAIENPDHARRLDQLPTRGQQPPFIYDLYAVTAHDGTLKGGHYTAYVNKPNNGWCHYDDVNVTRVPERAAVTSKAYLLFYQRVG